MEGRTTPSEVHPLPGIKSVQKEQLKCKRKEGKQSRREVELTTAATIFLGRALWPGGRLCPPQTPVRLLHGGKPVPS